MLLERRKTKVPYNVKTGSKFLEQFEHDLSQKQRKDKKEYEEARIQSLDTIIEKLYEDDIFGKISDDRFRKMSAGYEAEQAELKAKMHQLQTALNKA